MSEFTREEIKDLNEMGLFFASQYREIDYDFAEYMGWLCSVRAWHRRTNPEACEDVPMTMRERVLVSRPWLGWRYKPFFEYTLKDTVE